VEKLMGHVERLSGTIDAGMIALRTHQGQKSSRRSWGRAYAREAGNTKVSQISKTGTSASTRESQSILYVMLTLSVVLITDVLKS
jgi:hypothetical protein